LKLGTRNSNNNADRNPRNQFDVIVIGAGINGAGIARDAAMRGLKVCAVGQGRHRWRHIKLVNAVDHGGLRYLEHVSLASCVSHYVKERVCSISARIWFVHSEFWFPFTNRRSVGGGPCKRE